MKISKARTGDVFRAWNIYFHHFRSCRVCMSTLHRYATAIPVNISQEYDRQGAYMVFFKLLKMKYK